MSFPSAFSAAFVSVAILSSSANAQTMNDASQQNLPYADAMVQMIHKCGLAKDSARDGYYIFDSARSGCAQTVRHITEVSRNHFMTAIGMGTDTNPGHVTIGVVEAPMINGSPAKMADGSPVVVEKNTYIIEMNLNAHLIQAYSAKFDKPCKDVTSIEGSRASDFNALVLAARECVLQITHSQAILQPERELPFLGDVAYVLNRIPVSTQLAFGNN